MATFQEFYTDEDGVVHAATIVVTHPTGNAEQGIPEGHEVECTPKDFRVNLRQLGYVADGAEGDIGLVEQDKQRRARAAGGRRKAASRT